MAEDRYVILFLLIHLVLCGGLSILIFLGVLRISRYFILLTWLLPVWGGIITLIAEVHVRRKAAGSKEDELPQFEGTGFSSFVPTLPLEEETSQPVVPLEEAMVLGELSIRRSLMLKLIEENPKRYIPLLKRIRLESDPEVSHYASTAMMQIQREYELNLHQKEERMQKHPGDEEALEEYIVLLKEYIATGLLADHALTAQRRRLNTLFVQILSESDADKTVYLDAVDNLVELDEYTAAESLIEDANRRWPHDESFFLLQLKLYHKARNGLALKGAIQQINESGVYLSPDTRKTVAFWSGPSEGQDG